MTYISLKGHGPQVADRGPDSLPVTMQYVYILLNITRH